MKLVSLLKQRRGWRNVYDKIFIISPTFSLQTVWQQLDPAGIVVLNQMNTAALEIVWNDCLANTDNLTLLILDDVGIDARQGGNKITDQNILNKMIANSRHVNLSIIWLSQKVTMVPPVVRVNADCFCVYASMSRKEQDCLYAETGVQTRKRFDELFFLATKDPYSFFFASIENGKVVFGSSFTDVFVQ